MIATEIYVRRAKGPFIVAILIASFISLQIRYDRLQEEHFELRAPIHRFALPAPIVKHLSFGFRNVLADYYWVTAVQDFNKWDRYDAYYPEYFRIISSLDPHFEYPYIFAALTVPSKVNASTSLTWLSVIAQDGISAFPDNWEIPFYVGVEYHIVGKEYATATRYLALAAQKKGSPEMVRSTYAIYLMHDSSEYQKSRALFSAMFETSNNDETKSIAREHIELLDLIESLEQAGLAYKTKYGSYPSGLSDMSDKGFVSIPAQFAKKYRLSFDQATGKVILGK